MSTLTALLIDTVSIQKYIFSSNKLKDNIGASYIISDLLFGIVREGEFKPSKLVEESSKDAKVTFKIGYIGGGNMLLLFDNKAAAIEFLKYYSLNCLNRFPGVQIAYGMKENFIEEENGFKASMTALVKSLIENKNSFQPEVSFFKPGVIADCSQSGEALEYVSSSYDTKSSVLKVKLDNVNAANERLKEIVNNKDGFTFPYNTEDLSVNDEKSYISVVHIDGNGIGRKFMDQPDLSRLHNLSKVVADCAETSLKEFTKYVINLYTGDDPILKKEKGFGLAKSKDEGNYLPFRPLIIGGDDITFVCDGRLGLHFAEKFIQFLCAGDEPIVNSACAGVAIVKLKYPFARAYHLAEDLLKEAKEKSRGEKNQNEASYISYFISSGGYSGEINAIREKHQNNLSFGPYKVSGVHGLSGLKGALKELKSTWPKNKVMELREVLFARDPDRKYFAEVIKANDLPLPEGMSLDQNSGLFDVVDVYDFYPSELLEKNN